MNGCYFRLTDRPRELKNYKNKKTDANKMGKMALCHKRILYIYIYIYIFNTTALCAGQVKEDVLYR